MLKKLIIVAASLLVAKTVVEVAAEENEKVSSVVETVKTYIYKVVNKVAKNTKSKAESVIDLFDRIEKSHPNASEGVKLSAIGSVIGGGITAVAYFGFKMVTEYLPKAFSIV